MNFKPLHNNVLVKRLDEADKTAGGILLPDNAKEKPSQGEVLAVGPGAIGSDGKIQSMGVKIGDRVLFKQWGGTEVKIDGQDRMIMEERDILGIIG